MSPYARIALVVVGLSALAAAAWTSGAPKLERHVQSPEYCASCHGPDGTHAARHEALSCDSCHAPAQAHPLTLVWAARVSRAAMPVHGKLDGDSCRSCHEADPAKWSALLRSKGHAAHVGDSAAVSCVGCHGSSLHERPTDSERCEACHSDTIEKRPGTASLDCQRCHAFGPRGPSDQALAKAAANAWGREITGKNVHGSADCSLCHNPHRKEGEPEKAEGIECTSCHRGELKASNMHAPENHRECTTCHRPHGLREELATACAVCHQEPRVLGDLRDPGVPEDMREVTTIAPLLAARQGHAVPPPAVTHEGRCATCHEPHAWAANKEACFDCHEDEAKGVAKLPAETHSCLGCHEPHSAKPGDETCAQCHRDQTRAQTTVKPDKHKDCLSCHAPHQGKPDPRFACGKSCHEDKQAAVHDGAPKHRDCTSCHTPHGDPIAKAQLACARCHEDQTAHFKGSKHETCTGCHDDHIFDKAAALTLCTSCHEEPLAKNASHSKDPCSKCHEPHAAGPGPASDCASCHEDVLPRVKKHQTCNECHEPHLPKTAANTRCQSCHEAKVAVAKTWPKDTPHGAADGCAECHTRHDEARPKTCTSCHEEQQNDAHMGKHDKCDGCHEVHEPRPGAPLGFWGQCGSCHGKEGAAAASGLEAHQRCENCHDNPGRKPSQCLDCHKKVRESGAHAEPKHDECLDCHKSHGTTPPTRNACLSCHQDRKAHFPDAKECQSCHTFKKP